MYSPFSKNHKKAFESELVQNIVKEIVKEDEARLYHFSLKCLALDSENIIDEAQKLLFIDIAEKNGDIEKILRYTEGPKLIEDFYYRSYVFAKKGMYSKINSLKINFEEKFQKSLSLPRNIIVLASINMFLAEQEDNKELSKTNFEEILAVIITHKDEVNNLLFLSNLLVYGIKLYISAKDSEKAENLTKQLLNRAMEDGDQYSQVRALNFLTEININKGEFKKAGKYLQTIFLPLGDISTISEREHMLCNATKLEIAKGEMDKVIKLLQQRYLIAEKESKHKIIIGTELAEAFLNVGKVEEADTTIAEVLSINHNKGYNIVEPFITLSLIEMEKKNFEEATRLIEKIEKSKKEKPCYDADLFYLKALVAAQQGKLEDSKQFVKKAIFTSSSTLNYEVLMKSLLLDIKVQLDLLKTKKEKEEIENLLDKVSKVYYFSKEQFIPKLSVDMTILRSLIFISNGKKELATEELQRANKLSSKFHYLDKIKLISEFLELVEDSDKHTDIETALEFLQDNIDVIEEILTTYNKLKFLKTPKIVDNTLKSLGIIDLNTKELSYSHNFEVNEDENQKFQESLQKVSTRVLDEIDSSLLASDYREGLIGLITRTEDKVIISLTDIYTYTLKSKVEQFSQELNSESQQPLNPDSLNKLVKEHFHYK